MWEVKITAEIDTAWEYYAEIYHNETFVAKDDPKSAYRLVDELNRKENENG